MRRLVRRGGRFFVALLAVLFVYGVYVFLTLPDVRQLRTSNPKTTAFMELRAREARKRGDQPRRVQQWVPYSRLSPSLVRAVLLTEDAKFWKHDGLDYEQIKESVEVNIERGEFARGASTITQQLAKNLYLSPSKNPRAQAARASDRPPPGSGANQAANSRALPERHRVGRRRSTARKPRPGRISESPPLRWRRPRQLCLRRRSRIRVS